jgi:hypothetical protein
MKDHARLPGETQRPPGTLPSTFSLAGAPPPRQTPDQPPLGLHEQRRPETSSSHRRPARTIRRGHDSWRRTRTRMRCETLCLLPDRGQRRGPQWLDLQSYVVPQSGWVTRKPMCVRLVRRPWSIRGVKLPAGRGVRFGRLSPEGMVTSRSSVVAAQGLDAAGHSFSGRGTP